jgi:hypothetical protein
MIPSFRNTLALAAGAALAISFAFTPSSMPKLGTCLFRRVTELPCPGCGLTRSFCAISHGDFAGAWEFHPFGFAFYALAVTLVVWPFVARRRPELEAMILRSRFTWISLVLLLAGMFVFGGVRLWTLALVA